MNKVSLIDVEYDIDMSIIKMEQVASHLVGLLRHQNISRSELAKDLGWSKSRVTKVLSGDENLTIKTMTMITQKLGYDFDIIFHNKNYEKPKQPWQIDREKITTHQIAAQPSQSRPEIFLELQTGEQVVNAVLAGREKEYYVSITSPPNFISERAIQITPELKSDDSRIDITYFKQKIKVAHYE
ncbi:MAG: helix-turn-helix domain-containing protein [Staphylococcus equorum]|nr:helix-turn-helix domain-containing protein [Staphylococcus equorum]